MKITRDNYEPFFMDFLDGNLEEDQINQFLDFLEQNPDLKSELQLVGKLKLPEEKIVFSGKQELYKNDSEEQSLFDHEAVAYLEGDLNSEERTAFEAYLAAHPEMQKEYNRFAKTRLAADSGITFPNKQRLYRKSGSVLFLNRVARAAAVLVLLWGINSVFQTENVPKQQSLDQVVAVISPEMTPPVEKMAPPVDKGETEKKNLQPEVQEKQKATKTNKPKSLREQTKGRLEEKRSTDSKTTERDLMALAEISPIPAHLEMEPGERLLSLSRSLNVEKINNPHEIMTLEEFLASRAKKVSEEGMISAQRFVRAGLGVASELSGERIGYSVKDGKITSLDFESRLLAFSIPLKKNQ